MLILSRVCADFYDRNRNLIHRITPADRNLYYDAPDAIQQDPLFQLLLDDGSILLAESPVKQKAIENDPMAGADATGKSVKVSKPKTTRSKSKTDSKSEPDPEPEPASQLALDIPTEDASSLKL